MTLKYLLEKEIRQFFRNPFLPKLVILFPVAIMFIVPWIMNMDIKNINIIVVNQDNSSAAEQLIRRLESSEYFILSGVTGDYRKAISALEYGETDAVMEIPRDFEKDLMTSGHAPVQISLNAVNETKGTLGANYISGICADFSAEYLAAAGFAGSSGLVPKVSVNILNRFNPTMDYRHYMIPAFMIIILILLGGFLPALNIVGEKEKGTIEQINITPVSKFTFIFAKLIPYWVMGLLVLGITMLLAYLVYGLVPLGGTWIIFLFAVFFIFAISGFGLIVSNYSDTLQQAMFVMFFFVLVFMLMSGLLTPVASMPRWAQLLTYVNPPRYFIEVMRMVYLQGASLGDLIPQMAALVGFDIVLGGWAVLSYRKQE